MSSHDQIAALHFELPPVPAPIGTFRNVLQVGNILYVSGQGPLDRNGVLYKGKVGRDVSVEAAYEHARLTGLNILSVLSAHLGDLARVKQFVKLQGFVNATDDFADHPRVINGCSDLLVEVFGGRGIHARTSIGVASLPNNITVEIEAIVEIFSEGKSHG
ncbi:RidA family protein [Allomesorhizobium alhagi]|uniref:Translation initiation inhibitor protein n=1 Tax=Mesorhizobium alhagi CCNWXJ12-2 TaxID=1107882 RepID=H0HYB7_9HYPH|nr:RidA family protein [Mesorhizobium alhagi]EHK54255.1 translation initiation inhibitor protein [Mesorhizobium alhagi CCNWXJ12-2]